MSDLRRAVVGVIAAGLVVAGCGGVDHADRPQAQVAVAPPVTSPPVVRAGDVVPAGPPVVLPQPIDIPENSYAPEAVTQIGTMEIPKLKLVHPVYEGVTLNNIDLGPSHWPGTAEPGHVGNTVFAGHRVTHTSPFRHIDELVAGDKVIFDVHGSRSSYHVTETMVVDAADSWISDQTPTPTGTLYACHPPGSVSKRFVVRLALDSPTA
ncbi:MAG: class E sortase [Actinomycetota bacterium]|nr:class E sortase [Actinomycetota bacterium]